MIKRKGKLIHIILYFLAVFLKYFDNPVSDAVYVLGGLPSHRRMNKHMTYDQTISFHSRIRSIPNTSVFGKFMDTDQEIFIND